MSGTNRGFGAGSTAKSGKRRLRRDAPGDISAMECARLARAFDVLLHAVMARLRLHYAVRIAALDVLAGSERAAAIAALLSEQDVALARAREEIVGNQRQAMQRARQKAKRGRYRRTMRIEPIAPSRHGPEGTAVRPGQPVRRLTPKDHKP